jgi:hypothetical protein
MLLCKLPSGPPAVVKDNFQPFAPLSTLVYVKKPHRKSSRLTRCGSPAAAAQGGFESGGSPVGRRPMPLLAGSVERNAEYPRCGRHEGSEDDRITNEPNPPGSAPSHEVADGEPDETAEGCWQRDQQADRESRQD